MSIKLLKEMRANRSALTKEEGTIRVWMRYHKTGCVGWIDQWNRLCNVKYEALELTEKIHQTEMTIINTSKENN